MRPVKATSRERYFGEAVYEYGRLFLPIPSKCKGLFGPLLGGNLGVSVEVEGEPAQNGSPLLKSGPTVPTTPFALIVSIVKNMKV